MTGRRFNTSPSVSPALTGGDDKPRARCADDYNPFDVLAHKTAGREYEHAKADVLSDRLCGGCVLREGCWDDAHATDQPWFLSLRGKPVPHHAGTAA